jgi:hypothetical protein
MSSSSSSRRKLSNADAALALEQEAAEEADKRRRRRRAEFGDCALVEIVHLHDCLRGALGALQRDVNDLSATLSAQQQQQQQQQRGDDGRKETRVACTTAAAADDDDDDQAEAKDVDAASIERIADIERRVAGRFKVIWSVFQAHSAAEDEFIWPALQKKQASLGAAEDGEAGARAEAEAKAAVAEAAVAVAAAADGPEADQDDGDDGNQRSGPPAPVGAAAAAGAAAAGANGPSSPCIIEQEEYEEDHANEERMFETMDSLLTRLRQGLSEQRRRSSSMTNDATTAVEDTSADSAPSSEADADPGTTAAADIEVHEMAQKIDEITHHLKEHLFSHLDKEETHCMPLVVKHLNKEEIHELVGKIMGKRSSDQMYNIMDMAVQNLSPEDREEMIFYMKQAMYGTFFERWLTMSGWGKEDEEEKEDGEDETQEPENDGDGDTGGGDRKPEAKSEEELRRARAESSADRGDANSPPDACPFTSENPSSSAELCSACAPAGQCLGQTSSGSDNIAVANTAAAAPAAPSTQEEDDDLPEPTSQEELEKLIRAVATNSSLTAIQKSTTIQGLRDSVHKSQMERKRKLEETSNETSTAAAHSARARRVTPPSSYWSKKRDGTIELIWSSDSPNARFPPDELSVPLFSASELAPTYFDGANAAVLGCPHYARSCKVRHPASGRLYTCRHCCEQDREMPMKEQDSPLDRYEVKEIFCMKCNALQPVGEKCCNPKCGTKFARWFCKYCNLFDDSPSKKIYHCPFCNVCRAGRGLGIDYRHCMRCNACVSMDKKHEKRHNCISQKLQGNCPICHEGMFQTIKPLRALRCGHVMHLQCFSMYVRSGQWTCPLCKKSVEDMSEYFAQIDAAVRMQPMPASYAGTMSNIYCQDCCKSCVVPYHFVGIKCSHCGSYNTRELSRGVENAEGGFNQF